jgi:hypothetical protein
MDLNTKDIQLQYEGFLNTPFLWKSDAVFGLKQIEISKINTSTFNNGIVKNSRLGKRVERFVIHELDQQPTINIVAENIQIQNEKTTVGEIDCILTESEQPIHLEIIYKFYLYDESFGNAEIEHWIGPNRNDNLVKKLTKLKDKQLPLLYNSFTNPLLEKLNLKSENIKQRVYFKAQLFIPHLLKNSSFKLINNECIQGFYIHFNELEQFSDCKFFIPSKINWLQEVQTQTRWLTYNLFLTKVEDLINQQTAPLCWIKYPNGELQKFFVVWW